MYYSKKIGVKNAKKTRIRNFVPMVTDYGKRKVSRQNFSFITALPRLALENCGITTQVNVQLVQDKGEKFIKLTPIVSKEKGDVGK